MTRDFRLPQVMLLTVRNLTKSRRTPMLIFASLLQPVIWLVLFSQIFRTLADAPQFESLGYRSYITFFAPGMVVLSMLFTGLQSGMATMTDIDTGMLAKLLTSPIRRPAILGGRVMADAAVMVVQGVIVLSLAAAMGARVQAGWPGVITILVLAVAFGIVWASLSNLIALLSRNAELTMVAGLVLTLPALFLSSAFYPKPLLPGWLQGAMKANPAAYVITTGQQLMNTGNNWAEDLRTLAALAISGLILIPAAVTAFRSATQ